MHSANVPPREETEPSSEITPDRTDATTVIVFGNEKGGSGKSTCAMHVATGLLRAGYTVGTIDLDNRQRTLTRYLANRAETIRREGIAFPVPEHVALSQSEDRDRDVAEAAEQERFDAVLAKFRSWADFVVIDCPGTDSFLSRLATSHADKLVTPINDSLVDLDLLAIVNANDGKVRRPSVYAAMVWEQRKVRAMRDRGSIDWVVMRNRLSSINARNKVEMARLVNTLSKRVGFRIAPGFTERVIFRELFLRGLTMLDLLESGKVGEPRMSDIAARQEVRSLLNALDLPNWTH